jgi:hypothetical protein
MCNQDLTLGNIHVPVYVGTSIQLQYYYCTFLGKGIIPIYRYVLYYYIPLHRFIILTIYLLIYKEQFTLLE